MAGQPPRGRKKKPASRKAPAKEKVEFDGKSASEGGSGPVGMPLATEPTVENVLGLWTWKRKEADEQGIRRFIREVRMMCDMRTPVRIPAEYKAITREVRTPFVRDAWLRIASALVKDQPVPHVEPRDETDAAKRAATIGSRWIQGGMDLMDKQRNGMNTVYESARSLVRDSESVLKVVHRPDAWANFPERAEQEEADAYLQRIRHAKRQKGVRWPFEWRIVDRLDCYFGDGEYGDEWCLEYGEYPLPYVGSQYGMHYDHDNKRWVNPRLKIGGKPYAYGEYASASTGFDYALSSGSTGRAKKWEYWDRNWWAVVIDGFMAPDFPKPNPYAPWIPYFRAVSDPALYSLRFLVPALDNLLTMKQNWAYLSAFPVPVLESIESGQQFPLDQLPLGDDSQKPRWKWSPGKLNVPPVGYRFDFMQVPESGRDIDSLITIHRELIDIAGISSIFRGMSPGSRTPGYAINQLLAAANLMYRMLGDSLQRQFENAAEFMLHCVKDVVADEVFILAEVDE